MHRTTETIIYSRRQIALPPTLLSIVFFATLLMIGCAGPRPSAEPATATIPGNLPDESAQDMPQPTDEAILRPTPRDYVVEAGTAIPSVLDPLNPDNPASQRVMDNIFDSLLSVNAQTAMLLPGLAAEWTFSEDDLTATFKLRNDVQWHDGQPFTADDVVFTFDSLVSADTDSPFEVNVVPVETFFAADKYTFVVTLDSADCSDLYDIGLIPVIPRHLLEARDGEDASAIPLSTPRNWERPVGTGPFKFKERLTAGEIRLERNEAYFAGAPRISEWVYRPFDSEQQILGGLREGGIDIAAISPEQSRYFAQDNGIDLVTYPQAEYYALMLNNSRRSLQDIRVRRALGYAIDQDALVQELLNGFGQVIESPWLPNHWASPAISSTTAYNPDMAQQLLREAGWTDSDRDGLLDGNGQPLDISIAVNAENQFRKQIALSVQRYWLDAGISAEIHFVEFHALLEKLFARNFDAVTFSWPIHQDPDQSLFWASEETALNRAFNFVSYKNPVVDEALQRGLTTPFCNFEARAAAYQQAISTIVEDQPFVFLFAPQGIVATNHRLSGLEPGPYSDLSWNINEWTLDAPEVNS